MNSWQKCSSAVKLRLEKVYATSSVGGALEDPLTMVTLTSTENLKVDTTKGPVEIGKDADLVVLAPDLMVHAVLISGQSVLL